MDEDERILRSVLAESRETAALEAAAQDPPKDNEPSEEMSEGITAALARLRDSGG